MDLRDLYQELILDHGRRPRNFRTLEHPTCSVEGHNPLCGDHFTVHVDVHDGVIREVAFEGGGCAISTASSRGSCPSRSNLSLSDSPSTKGMT